MLAAMDEWANPSSPHAAGRRARAALEEARARVAAALGWTGEVIFTSGASEAIALAVTRAKVGRVEASPFEHDAVRRAIDALLPSQEHGMMLARQTVNSETGIILDPPATTSGDLWLADCAQSAGKLPLPDADLIVASGHKLGAPPGVGALLVRDLATLAATGGQERGYRGGTENLPAILSLAAALESDRGWLDEVTRLRARLDDGIRAAGGTIVGGDRLRLATIAAYRMPGLDARAQLIRLDLAGIAVSAGSACSSGTLRTSSTLAALGLDERAAGEVIRVGLGWTSTEADVDRFLGTWRTIAGEAGRRAA